MNTARIARRAAAITLALATLTGIAGINATAAHAAPATTAAAAADMHVLSDLPPVENQKNTSACAAYSIAYVIGSYYTARTGQAGRIDPLPTYAQTLARASQKATASAGQNSDNVFNQASGINMMEAWTTAGTAGVYAANGKIRPAQWHVLPGTDRAPVAHLNAPTWLRTIHGDLYPEKTIRQALTDALDAGNPVALNINIRDRFMDYQPDITRIPTSVATIDPTVVYRWDAQEDATIVREIPSSYHAVVAVGYTNDGLIIQNSWGTDWGQGGYAIIDWEYINHQLVEAQEGQGLAA